MRWVSRPRALVAVGAVIALAVYIGRPGIPARLHVVDQAGVLSPTDRQNFEQYLERVFNESDIDVRFVFVRETGPRALEELAVHEMQALGVGEGSRNARGLLLLYDFAGQRARIEVGYGLEEYFPDGFVGYLLREHARTFFASGDPTHGLMFLVRILHDRIREATLGNRFDPRIVDILRTPYLSGGAGTSGPLPLAHGARPPGRDEAADGDGRSRYVAQATPDAAYQRYLEWMASGRFVPDVPLFTPQSRRYLAAMPMSHGYFEYILLKEYGRAYRIYENDDVALLYFTDDPLVCPHFFTRGAEGWQMDIQAEVANTTNRAGGVYTWDYRGRDDSYTNAFGDKLIKIKGYIRLIDGDNRMLPVRGTGKS